MTVYDCFMFNNELDLLELRLTILDDVVDRFVLVEAGQSHTGLAKPLHFHDNIERFARWRGRIDHVALPNLPPDNDAWANDSTQRNAIGRGLPDVADDDLVIVSDIDEIPRRESIEAILADPSIRIAGLRMPLFYLRFNYLQMRGGDPVYVWGVAARGDVFRRLSPQRQRDARVTLQKRSWAGTLGQGETVLQHAGWHFSYLGDDDHVRLKLASYTHQENAVSKVLEEHGVKGILASGLDLFGRPGYQWGTVQVNDYFPEELRRDMDRYGHLLAPDPSIVIDPVLCRQRDTVVMRRMRR
jgi:beta-1,4-mannosyl-glycoprotein beta-1,4-N-acetylglucosaminyltransferase